MPARLQLQGAAVAVRDAVGAADGRELAGAARATAYATAAGRHALAAVRAHAAGAYTARACQSDESALHSKLESLITLAKMLELNGALNVTSGLVT